MRTLGVVVLAVVAVTAAQAAPARDGLIRPGVGIAKIRLGMTIPQLRKAMGPPQAVARKQTGFGRSLIEYQYAFGSYNAQLSGAKGRERVIAISTFFAGERTVRGIGVSSLEAQVAKEYPALRCDAFRTRRIGEKYAYRGLHRVCALGDRDDPQTVFIVHGPVEQTAGPNPSPDPPLEQSWPREARIFEVIVRVPGYEHPDERQVRES